MKKLSQISPSVVPQWTACANCTNGWVTRYTGTNSTAKRNEAETSHATMVRCQCVKAHAQRVADALKAAGKK